MLQRIAITFRCGSKQIFRVILKRYVKRAECSQRSGFESFDSMNGVVHWTRRAGEVKYVIDFSAIARLVDVNLAKFKPAFVLQMRRDWIFYRSAGCQSRQPSSLHPKARHTNGSQGIPLRR